MTDGEIVAEILGRAISEILPDHRASGSPTEHAQSTAKALLKAFEDATNLTDRALKQAERWHGIAQDACDLLAEVDKLRAEVDRLRAERRQLRARLVECLPWVGRTPYPNTRGFSEMFACRDLARDTLEEVVDDGIAWLRDLEDDEGSKR